MIFAYQQFCSTSRPKLLKRPIVSYSLGGRSSRLQSLKKFFESIFEKNRVEYFPVKKYRFTLVSIVSSVSVLS